MTLTLDERLTLHGAVHHLLRYADDMDRLQYARTAASVRERVAELRTLLEDKAPPLDVDQYLADNGMCWPGDPDEQVAA